MTHDAASRAAEAIADLLAGALRDCDEALRRHDVEAASAALAATGERLRRIRRDLREEGGRAEAGRDEAGKAAAPGPA